VTRFVSKNDNYAFKKEHISATTFIKQLLGNRHTKRQLFWSSTLQVLPDKVNKQANQQASQKASQPASQQADQQVASQQPASPQLSKGPAAWAKPLRFAAPQHGEQGVIES